MIRPLAAPLLACSLLAACAQTARPVVPVEPAAASSREVRRQLGEALESQDRVALTRNAITLARMGATLSDASFERIAPLFDDAVLAKADFPRMAGSGTRAERLHRWFGLNAAGGPVPPLAAEVPAEYRLVEGIARDPANGRLFVGTVVEGRLAYLEGGQWHEVPLGSPRGGLFGMAVDAGRRLLWIATGSLEQTAVEGDRMAGLIAVDLDKLTVTRRVPLPAGAAGVAGDLTVAADGTVYASNVVSGAIHRCLPGCTVLEDLLPPGTFRNPQGLALLQSDRWLYIADYVTGLWRVKFPDLAPVPVTVSVPTMLDGIDGLVAMDDDATLVALQNGIGPRRIGKISPNTGKMVIADVRYIVPPSEGEPTLAALAPNDELLFVADSQWERYGPGGAFTDGKPARPTPIRRLDVHDEIVTTR